MIAIIIATYQRQDGMTPFYLKRALESIKNQTFKDYQVYVIGDNYESNNEFKEIVDLYPELIYFNLKKSNEREKYSFGDYRLFCAGGVTAAKIGIDLAVSAGYKYVCHLDHDDFWEPNHLELISQVAELDPLFICTLSTHNGSHLPKVDITNEVFEYYPVACGLICSSTCVKYSDTELRGRDVFAETGTAYPADADLWVRLAAEMKSKGRKGYLISSLTCHHEEEGYSLKK